MVTFSVTTLVVPVCLGRFILHKLTDNRKINELYTIGTGLYSIWLSVRLVIVVYGWIQMGALQLFQKFKERIKIVT
jgi:hypothetical protein